MTNNQNKNRFLTFIFSLVPFTRNIWFLSNLTDASVNIEKANIRSKTRQIFEIYLFMLNIKPPVLLIKKMNLKLGKN